MKIDSLGIPYFTETDLVKMIQDGHVNKCAQVLCEDSQEIQKFNQAAGRFGRPPLEVYKPTAVTMEQFDNVAQLEWFMPDEYRGIDLYSTLVSKCNNQKELDRLEIELAEYKRRNMTDILRYMVFLVDFMREQKIVWGVGRGSSVASFVLYLIGVHRINSIQYDLDFNEFMR